MKLFFSYLYPATVFHFGCVLLYDLIWLAGFTGPLDAWWTSFGDLQVIIYIVIYVVFVVFISILGVVQRWHQSLRWVLEMGSRRGLRIGGVPIFDLTMLIFLGGLSLVIASHAPSISTLFFYLVAPISFASIFNFIFRLPPDLHFVVDRSCSLADIAQDQGCDQEELARENGLKKEYMVGFAQELRLPIADKKDEKDKKP